jgi:hypothetical protein
MRRVYAALKAFQKRYGRLPKTPWELIAAGKRGEVSIADSDFRNPDVAYSDNETLRNQIRKGAAVSVAASYGMEWIVNGEQKDRPVKWLSSDSYVRSNGVIRGDSRFQYDPKGFYMFLWSDGTITRVSLAERRMVNDGPASWRVLRDGEEAAGRRTLREDEFLRLLGERGGLHNL